MVAGLLCVVAVAAVFVVAESGLPDSLLPDQQHARTQSTERRLAAGDVQSPIAASSLALSSLWPGTPARSARHSPAKAGTKVPNPPADKPWAATYRLLEPLAKDGSVAAARRLYEDTCRCLKYHALPTIITGETASFQVPGASSSAAAAAYASRLDRLSEDARQLTAMCKSTDSSTLKQALPRVLENAAVLGVPGAGTCYVSGQLFGYSQSPEGQAFKPEYRRVAGQIIRASLARGNWRMLHLLTHAADEKSRFASSWVLPLLGNDPKVLYGLNRLELMGATGDEASEIQSRLVEIAARAGLSQQDVAYLDQWAEQMYAKYFRDKPREGVSGGACQVQ